MTSPSCRGCGAAAVEILLDFGLQPPSNRFVPCGAVDPDRHNLQLGQCTECGLLQLVDPMPAAMVRARQPWLKYNEPEGHLDALVEYLAKFITPHAKIAGVTYKDDSTLTRFSRLGYHPTLRYDMILDFGVSDPCAGLETVQNLMNDERAGLLAHKYGKADLVVVRHVLEHAHDPVCFLKALSQLLAPGGKLVLEVPDSRKFVEACDYSFIWEEHISYFTPRTLVDFARRYAWNVLDTLIYSYPLEDSLVMILERSAPSATKAAQSALPPDLEPGRRFARRFDSIRLAYRNYLEPLRKSDKHIAVFGAGHLAVKFLNLFNLKDSVDCVIDDNPHKHGLTMPGSRLPILDSSHLLEMDLCLLSLSPESEQKVLSKQPADLKNTGRFASIFALSPLTLRNLMTPPNLRKINDGVFVAEDPIVKAGPVEVTFLKAQAKANPRKRARICAHKNQNSLIQEMIIAIAKESYVRPHKHLKKSESFHVIEGEVDVVIFDEEGTVKDVIELKGQTHNRSFYYRLDESRFHTLVVWTDFFVFHEVTSGPFVRENTIPAVWAPSEDSPDRETENYRKSLAKTAQEYKLMASSQRHTMGEIS